MHAIACTRGGRQGKPAQLSFDDASEQAADTGTGL
jgi:hypothetical protein